MERVIAVTGSLAPRENTTVSVKVAGRLQSINVDLGTAVEEGDLLAQVEPHDYELRLQQAAAALAQARAAVGLPLDGDDDRFDADKTSAVKQARAILEEATKNRERVSSLSKEGIAPKAEMDVVEAAHVVALNRYEAALEDTYIRQAMLTQRRAEFELAKKQLADTAVRAPFDGVIQVRLAHLGEFLSAGSSVVTMVTTGPLRLRLEVPERWSAAVRLGQSVRLQVEGNTNFFVGVIARLSPALSEQNRMLVIEADVPNNDSLRPGLFAQARIVINDEDEGLAVPRKALVTFAGLEKVLVAKDGEAVERTVTTGRRGEDWIEILAGLKLGELVVLDPGNLRTGQPIVVADPVSVETSQTSSDTGP